MAFRRQPSNPNPYPFANQPGQQSPQHQQQQQQQQQHNDEQPPPPAAPATRKRPRAPSDVGDGSAAPSQPDPFHHENGSDASDASEDGGKPDKKAGRRKIKIEFIQDKSRRHITFSKRKAGIMKKAYELSTLTGTQVLLLVVSETGLVYTFTTAKLQPLVTQPEGKNLIQACLNAPHGSMPSSLPVGAPIGRSAQGSSAGGTTGGSGGSGGVGMGSGPGGPGRNVPGGLAIAGDKDSDPQDQDSRGDPADDEPPRPRRASATSAAPPAPKDSPPRKPSSGSPALMPLQYPGAPYPGPAGMGLALDSMYGGQQQQGAAQQQQQQQYMQGAQGAAQGGYMGGGWQGQPGYARR